MSGGFFNYDNYRLADLARTLEEVVNHNDEDEYYGYSPETIRVFKETVYLLQKCDILMHRIDWLLSADDSEEGFHKHLAKQLKQIECLNKGE